MLWFGVIFASIAVYSWKLMGQLVPERFVSSKRAAFISGQLTIALLAGLVGVQAFVTNGQIVIDSRLIAVVVAAILSWRKVPFILTVLLAGLVVALCRLYLGF